MNLLEVFFLFIDGCCFWKLVTGGWNSVIHFADVSLFRGRLEFVVCNSVMQGGFEWAVLEVLLIGCRFWDLLNSYEIRCNSVMAYCFYFLVKSLWTRCRDPLCENLFRITYPDSVLLGFTFLKFLIFSWTSAGLFREVAYVNCKFGPKMMVGSMQNDYGMNILKSWSLMKISQCFAWDAQRRKMELEVCHGVE